MKKTGTLMQPKKKLNSPINQSSPDPAMSNRNFTLVTTPEQWKHLINKKQWHKIT